MNSMKQIKKMALVMTVAGLATWAVGCQSPQSSTTSMNFGMQTQPSVQVKSSYYHNTANDTDKNLRISMTAG